MKLKDLYQKHSGKVSQKWSIYLNQYEEKLNHYKKLPIKLLEIGIENGGSLEIYSKYFPNAEIILGCDLQHYHFSTEKAKRVEVLIARTGYTGEDGFEIYFKEDYAEYLFRNILEAGKKKWDNADWFGRTRYPAIRNGLCSLRAGN